ncbi:MAG: hypothetical protein V1872_05765 [bacterium]
MSIKLVRYGYPRKFDPEEGLQPIEIKELIISSTPNTLREIATFLNKNAELMESLGEKFEPQKFPKGLTDLPEILVSRMVKMY